MNTHGPGTTTDPRPLTEREREILEFLLSPEVPGITELRQQGQTAIAQPWECGCASFDLVVDKQSTSASTLRSRPAMVADAKAGASPAELVCVMLWVDEQGWLSSVEVVDVADEHGKFNPIPPRSMYKAPQVGGGPASTTKGLRSVVARLLGRKA